MTTVSGGGNATSCFCGRQVSIEEVERQVKVLMKNLAIFFLFPNKEFLPLSFKIQLLEISPQKQKDQRQKQLGADRLVTTQIWQLKTVILMFFHFLYSLNIMQYLNHELK
jgi:hypothetical protein